MIIDGITDSTGTGLKDGLIEQADFDTATNVAITASSAKNRIINGNFGINQRSVTGSVVLSAGSYGHDRFKAGTGGCSYTFSTTDNVTTITISAGTLIQVVEGTNLFSGTHTLSWEGTATGQIAAGGFAVSGVSATLTGGTNTTVEFGTGTISKVQLEEGSNASDFESRSIGEELALCQRYYEVGSSKLYLQQNTGGMAIQSYFITEKRTAPTITYVGGNYPYASLEAISTSGFRAYRGSTNEMAFNWTADAEL